MCRRTLLSLMAAGALLAPSSGRAQSADQQQAVALVNALNETLRAEWMDIRVEQVEYFTIGGERAATRLHQREFRWVPGDPRRQADGDRLTYLVDLSDGGTASGLTPPQTEAAIDGAMSTWAAQGCLAELVKRPDGGADPDIFDAFFGFGEPGDYRLADIVHAGFLPREFFEAVAPGAGDSIVAIAVSYIYVARGVPTDVDGDQYHDTAAAEIYYNDAFAWSLGGALPGVDVESVALHEAGHALGLGHFGPPPTAVMNPTYGGQRRALGAVDGAGACTVWSPWPR